MDFNKFICRRWKVDGFYRHVDKTLSWVFERNYLLEGRGGGNVVWEFADGLLTCYIDGQIDHRVRYAIFNGCLLRIYYPSVVPFFYHEVKQYLIIKYSKEKGLWLWETDRSASSPGIKRAIKLSPAKKQNTKQGAGATARTLFVSISKGFTAFVPRSCRGARW